MGTEFWIRFLSSIFGWSSAQAPWAQFRGRRFLSSNNLQVLVTHSKSACQILMLMFLFATMGIVAPYASAGLLPLVWCHLFKPPWVQFRGRRFLSSNFLEVLATHSRSACQMLMLILLCATIGIVAPYVSAGLLLWMWSLLFNPPWEQFRGWRFLSSYTRKFLSHTPEVLAKCSCSYFYVRR